MAVTREIAKRQMATRARHTERSPLMGNWPSVDRFFGDSLTPRGEGDVFYSASLTGQDALDVDNNAGLRVRRWTKHGSSTLQMVFINDIPGQEGSFADSIALNNHQDGEIRAFLEAMVNLAAHYGITTETAAGFSGSRLHPEDIKEAAEAVDAMEFASQKFEDLKNAGMQKVIGKLFSEESPLEPAVVKEIHKTVDAYLEGLKTRGPIYGSFDHLMKGSDVA